MLGHLGRYLVSLTKSPAYCKHLHTCKTLEKLCLSNKQRSVSHCQQYCLSSYVGSYVGKLSTSGHEQNDGEETDPFLKKEIEKFKKAKRWLAKMMGEDPETFTQKDIDEAIQYLLPSHLWATDARPQMKHPYLLFPPPKEKEFGEHGRPVSAGFYTKSPKFHDLVFEIWSHVERLNTPLPALDSDSIEDPPSAGETDIPEIVGAETNTNIDPMELELLALLDSGNAKYPPADESNILSTDNLLSDGENTADNTEDITCSPDEEAHVGTGDLLPTDESKPEPGGPNLVQWATKLQLQEIIGERISDKNYNVIIFRLKRLARHERAHEISDFLEKFQVAVSVSSTEAVKEAYVYEHSVRAMGYRKRAIAEVVIREGSGLITIDSKPLLEYFPIFNDREQIMFPLLVIDELERYDIECHVIGGGASGKSGAIRLAISRGIAAWRPHHHDALSEAGLLIRDYRKKERKKPGRKRARRAFQWVKR